MNYVVSIITKNIVSHSFIFLCNFFNSIHNTYDNIMNSNITNIKFYKYELEKTDIKNKLSIILSLLKIIINKYNKNDNIEIDYEIIDFYNLLENCPEVLKLSIESILDIIIKIKNNLEIINEKIIIYKNSFINFFYKINIEGNIKNIILYNNIFDKKISILFKLIKLYNININ